jgi:hypothetical protein
MIMNRTLHIATVVAVAAHMLCGCAFHHAYDCGGSCDTRSLAVSFGVEASCPCHHASAGPRHSCDHPSQHQPCDEERCVFARPDSDDTPDLSIGHTAPNPVCVSPGLPALGGADRVDSILGEPGPPIPLHLLNQVLLI